ncbi:hypothetical protein SLEP1_g15354 [Rubroshorea leprosula]|uniref:AAA+ ATPase domain-containing protein n=1 Tax=Rubroshorea leprosula TaxID=152421 RepID=A0AAV5IT17_9ROSI|nr:hypothetical protein SLEP1_g15354 [Rubroshorea leprosula]
MDRLGPIIDQLRPIIDFLGPIIELLKPLMTAVCRHLECHVKLQENVEELSRVLGDLNNLLEDNNLKKQNAEACPRKVVRREVMMWIEKVQTINNEVQVLELNFQNVSYLHRGSLGKRVHKKIEEVKGLILQQGSFPDDIAIDQPPGRGMTLPTEDARGRTDVTEQIWGYLMGDAVGMIGVCGPGGIGKTTLMKNIHNDLLNGPKFNKVIWATVPYPISIVKLQANIAHNMQLTLPENVSEEQRAATLSEILSRVRFVLILDDAWGTFSFEDVGIPKPTQQNGCKVIITSRSVELCNYIGCEQVIRMQQFPEKESLNLFLDTVGHDVLLKIPNLEETLKLVVAECAGLPLAIVVIARSMRGANDISAWKYALFELKNRVKRVKGWDDKIFERLKFSYDRLNDAELQNCFLHCSLYPKDGIIWRSDLIEDWIDNALIEQLETRKLMRDRANVILDSLINKCLIERVEHYSDYGMRMHDVMRDMALQVAGPRFMAKAGLQLTEAPEANEWTEDLEKVWLRANRITDFASSMSLNCPKLSGLDLSWNCDLRQIPDSFFAHMIGLKFLTLSGTAIEALPDSISILRNLTVLELDSCRRLRYMPSLVKLKALKKLDLQQAGIVEVPQGLEMLVNLQHLDLRCPNLAELPMEILCNLTHLQFLAMVLAAAIVRKAEKVIKLKVLETFIGQFDDLQVLNNFVRSFHEDQKFTRYWLSLGLTHYPRATFDGKMRFVLETDYYDLLAAVECTKIIALRGVELGRDYSVLLLNDFQLLKITECSDVKNLSETSLFNIATDLRYCEIDGCEGLECMLDLFSSSSVCSSFDKLEILWLNNLRNLQVLVKVEAQAGSAPSTSRAPRPTPSSIFANLKNFKIRNCPGIKKLFPFELLKGLRNLEEIDVRCCRRMKEIIEVEDGRETITTVGNNETIRLDLPKLRKLSLKELPKLKSICTTRGVMVCDSLQSIEIYDCPMLNRIPLYLPLLPNGELSLPSSLQEICIESEEWWELLLWDNPSAKDIFLPLLKPSVNPSLHKGFDDLKDFNNFVSSFQGQKLTSYELSVEATDDDGNDSSDSDFDFALEFGDDDCSKMLNLNGMEINEDYPVLPPDDLQILKIKKCCGLKSLNDASVFKALSDLRSIKIKQFDQLECILEMFSLSSECSPFDRFSLLKLVQLPNLRELVKVKGQAASAPSTTCAPTQPSVFSHLKMLLIYKCPRIKKLFPSELLKGLQNLEFIFVIGCAKMEEIIEVEEEKETLMTDGENEAITVILPKLKALLLVGLSNLKSICTARGVMGCDSLEEIGIAECPKLKRIPLHLPLLPDGVLCSPPSLRNICIKSKECWESLVWDNPSAKEILLPFLDLEEDFTDILKHLTDTSETEDE